MVRAVCPNCGAAVSAEARFCGACGRPIPAGRTCANCGAALSETAQFCGTCGAPVALPGDAGHAGADMAVPTQRRVAAPTPPRAAPPRPAVAPAAPPRRSPWLPALLGIISLVAICACTGALLFIFSARSGGGIGPVRVGGGEATPQWKLEATKTYVVPGGNDTRITDSVTGYTIRFPTGGSGNLLIAEIISGSAAPSPGQGIWIDYQGNTPIQLMVKDPGDALVTVMGFGYVPGAIDDESGAGDRWVAVPEEQSVDGYLVFDLLMPFEPSNTSHNNQLASVYPVFDRLEQFNRPEKQGSRKIGFNHYWISSIPENSDVATKRNHIQLQIGEFIDSFLNELPPSIQARARAEVNGRLRWHYEDSHPDSYRGFWWFSDFSRRPHPTITINANNAPSEYAWHIAHEAGHYMSHVLMGDDAYARLERQGRRTHGLGDYWEGRTDFVEEPAYFSEYAFNVGIAGSINPADPAAMFLKDKTPLTIDFPSVEGFGCLFLASLHRDNPTIKARTTGKPEEAPVVQASLGELFEIIGRGATDINQLRAHVEEFLRGRGEADKLPAIAQRIGWSYSVRGRLVNDAGKPVADATVESISKVGSKEYPGGYSSIPTKADGQFTISGDVFPGESWIRVKKDSETTDVPITIDWAHRTNEVVDLGDLKVQAGVLDLLHLSNYVDIGIRVADNPVDFLFTAGNVTWNGTAFSAADSYETTNTRQYNVNRKISASGVVSANGTILQSIVVEIQDTWVGMSERDGWRFEFVNLPLDSAITLPSTDGQIYPSVSYDIYKDKPDYRSFIKDWTHTDLTSGSTTDLDWDEKNLFVGKVGISVEVRFSKVKRP
jgi:hypothetical protein